MRTRTRIRTRVWLAAMLAVLLVAAACSDDSDSEASAATDDSSTDDSAPSDDAADETAPEGDDSPPTDDGEGDDPAPTGPNLEGELVGLFSIDPTDCAVAGSESGSWFRMVLIGGTAEDGPFLENGDSTCADLTITPLAPGTDGGLLTGQLQPGAEPLFDEAGNATADRIAAPTPFFAVAFAMATTDESDPPAITATSGELSGDLSAVAAYYGG